MKYFMISLGCSKNLVDAEGMLGNLNEAGHILVDCEENADVIIVNTCAFIDSAKQEAIDTIISCGKYKENNLKLLIVTGCLAQRFKDEILNLLPEVDAVVGVADYHRICEVIDEAQKKKMLLCSDINTSPLENPLRVQSTPFYTAFLKIAEGCDNHCTYCVIPSIRGRYRSRTIESIVKEAEKLAENGVRELIVIAQDTTRYGIDIYNKPMLSELLKKLCNIVGIRWIRVHYTYPELITDELISVIANEGKIVKYLDIPIQHSEDSVLKRMGRRSTKSQLVGLIKRLRENIPGLVLRTSIIVGFPGETKEDFNNLCEFVKMAKIDRVGVFEYSKEDGTPASRLKGQVLKSVKHSRYKTLMGIQKEISKAKNEQKVGCELEVLVEYYDSTHDVYVGRTCGDSVEIDGNIMFESSEVLDSGDFVKVSVVGFDEYSLVGDIIKKLEV